MQVLNRSLLFGAAIFVALIALALSVGAFSAIAVVSSLKLSAAVFLSSLAGLRMVRNAQDAQARSDRDHELALKQPAIYIFVGPSRPVLTREMFAAQTNWIALFVVILIFIERFS